MSHHIRVLNKKITYSPCMVAENLVLVAVFFLVPHCPEPSVHKDDEAAAGGGKQLPSHDDISQPGVYGIPLVRSLYGEEAVIFVAFYIVGYNLLVYSTAFFWLWGQGMIEDAGKEAAKQAGFPGRRCSISEWAPVSRQFLYLLFT